MTTREENEVLTRVGPGTPMGELFRHYWLPVGISLDLKDKPTFVRVLGEDLVLFRDSSGRVGLLGALCSHRRANLCLGTVAQNGLRCRYHGWLYDTHGRVLHTPSEPPESTFKDSVTHLAYPVQELGGIIFAYLGLCGSGASFQSRISNAARFKRLVSSPVHPDGVQLVESAGACTVSRNA